MKSCEPAGKGCPVEHQLSASPIHPLRRRDIDASHRVDNRLRLQRHYDRAFRKKRISHRSIEPLAGDASNESGAPHARSEPEIIRHCPSSRRVVPTFFMAVLGLFPCAMRLCTPPIPLPVNLPAGAGTSCGEPKLPNPPAPRLADVAAGVFQAAKIIRSEATGPVNVIVDTRDTGRHPPPAHAFYPHRFAWIFQSVFNFQSSPRWFLT